MAGKTIKRAIKNGAKWAAYCVGTLSKNKPPATRILTYHSIGYRQHEMNVTPEDFREQIAWLGEEKIAISLDAAAAAPEQGAPGLAAVATFAEWRRPLYHSSSSPM